MTDKVADASAIAAILFLEPGYEAVKDALSDCDLFAPALIRFELANVCLKKIRARPQERDELLNAFASLNDFGIRDCDFRVRTGGGVGGPEDAGSLTAPLERAGGKCALSRPRRLR